MYYADTTIQRDRLDQVLTNSSFIIDFKTDRQYVISRGNQIWFLFTLYNWIENETFKL